jgi:mannose-6-phosphate isomerase-like protein (cupin superfamily)
MPPAASSPVLGPDSGERVAWPGLGVRFMIDGDQTEGRFSLIEHPIAPRALAAPTHVHEREDEYSFVLEGRVGFQLGDEVLVAGPGELVFKPRGIPHAFWNAGDEPARLLELISPAGFENYFRELGPLLAGGGPPDFEALGELQARYSLSMDPSTAPPLMADHGLDPEPAVP